MKTFLPLLYSVTSSPFKFVFMIAWMSVLTTENSSINQHEFHVGPVWFVLVRTGIVLVKLVD